MKYSERRQFVYDPALNALADVQIALKLHDEYIQRYSPKPNRPRFFEVDRGPNAVDPMWQSPIGHNPSFLRELDIPSINQFQTQTFKPKLKFDSVPTDRSTTRRDKFWISNLELERQDYLPVRGDQVYWNGYRHQIVLVTVPPESYWGQTGVWLGLVCECELLAAQTSADVSDLATAKPAELATAELPIKATVNPWFPFNGSPQ